MKKLLIITFIVGFSGITIADQLAWITKEQAEQTIQFFETKEIKQAVLWCACCDNDEKILIDIINIYYKPASNASYYEVYIEGTNPLTGRIYNQPVDLAYVHIKRGGKWRCLGKELKFECDPCTKPFKF